jgi:hypothetical protein
MKIKANQHFWGVIAQCKNPYREFAYCDRCNRYKENNQTMSHNQFKELACQLRVTDNPMYYPDSNEIMVIRSVTRTQHINEVNALRSQNKLK